MSCEGCGPPRLEALRRAEVRQRRFTIARTIVWLGILVWMGLVVGAVGWVLGLFVRAAVDWMVGAG